MAYKTILTIVTDLDAAKSQIETAIQVARRQDAHLEALCLGVDRTQTGYYYAGAAAFVQQEAIDRCKQEAQDLEKALQHRLGNTELRWSTEAVVVQLGAIGAVVGMRARFADLVVMGRPYGEGRGVEIEAAVEASLFEGQAPVLIVPDGYTGEVPAHRVVIAWNQTDESLTAVRKAMPFLKSADLADITVIDPPAHGPERSDPGGQLSQMLSRHGVKTEVSVLAKTMPRISDVLNRHVRESEADLVVMGAYSHSRFREAILGGATRHMLELADTPVLMAR